MVPMTAVISAVSIKGIVDPARFGTIGWAPEWASPDCSNYSAHDGSGRTCNYKTGAGAKGRADGISFATDGMNNDQRSGRHRVQKPAHGHPPGIPTEG